MSVFKVLIIKTSSLGDIIHTLPAITEAKTLLPHIQFDWLVDESFQEIPAWHPAVHTVIPIPLRRWRKQWWKAGWSGEIKSVFNQVRKESYDLIIDAQGLLKSALLAWICKGTRIGLSFTSIREPIASLFYQKKCVVPNYQKAHAIMRARLLFAKSLGYSLPNELKLNTDFKNISYGLEQILSFKTTIPMQTEKPYCVFLHATTWTSKLWPESYWLALSSRLKALGFDILLPWGNSIEYEAAQRIKAKSTHVFILPSSTLTDLAFILGKATAVVSVDTGLGHLSAALGVPTVALFGSTDPELTSPIGCYQKTLSANFVCSPCLSRTCTYKGVKTIDPPCYASLGPEKVIETMMQCLEQKTNNQMRIGTA